MKINLPLTICLLLFLACSDSEPAAVKETEEEMEPEVVEEKGEWNLVFEEEFDADFSAWSVWNSGAYNNEIQLYRPEQLTIEEGILTISTQREAVTGDTDPFNTTQKNFEYVSGRIETKETYGPSEVSGETDYRFVARIQLPEGNGMWPAFWSTSDPWPTNGEIDILEARGNEPMKYQSNIFYGTVANMPISKNEDTEKEHHVNVDLTHDFHSYELIWTKGSLEIKFDDQLLYTYNANSKNYIASFFGKKHHIILNNAVGGAFFNNASSANFTDNAIMKVDWVRVYKR